MLFLHPFSIIERMFANFLTIPGLFFFIFVFSIQLTVTVQNKFLPMTGIELPTSGIGSDCNWVTTTAQNSVRNFFGPTMCASDVFKALKRKCFWWPQKIGQRIDKWWHNAFQCLSLNEQNLAFARPPACLPAHPPLTNIIKLILP